MSDAKWFFAKNNQQQGPVDASYLCSLFASKELPLQTLVWTAGLANWVPASQVESFVQAAQQSEQATGVVAAGGSALEQPEAAPAEQRGAAAVEQPEAAVLPSQQAEDTGNRGKFREGWEPAAKQYDPDTGERPTLAMPDAGFDVNPEQFRFEEALTEGPFSAEVRRLVADYQSQWAPNAVPSAPEQTSAQSDGVALPGNVAQQDMNMPEFVSGVYVSVNELDAIPAPATVKAQGKAAAEAAANVQSANQRLQAPTLRGRGALSDSGLRQSDGRAQSWRGGNQPEQPLDQGVQRVQPTQREQAKQLKEEIEQKLGPKRSPRRIVDPTSSSTHKALQAEVGIFSGLSVLAFMHALRRFLARTIDSLLFAIPGALIYWIIVSLVLLNTHDAKLGDSLSCICPLLLTISCFVMEVVVLSAWGTTLGKKLLGISLAQQSGALLDLQSALKRTTWLFVYIGWAFFWIPFLFSPLFAGIGIHNLGAFLGNLIVFAMTAFQFHRFMNTGATSYDKRSQTSCRLV